MFLFTIQYFFFCLGVRELWREKGQSKDDIGLLKTMSAGAVGGMVFWTLTYPIDVVKSRIQVYNLRGNFIRLTYEILMNEGLPALYNGLFPTLVRTIPSTAVLFVTYEYSKKIMHGIFREF